MLEDHAPLTFSFFAHVCFCVYLSLFSVPLFVCFLSCVLFFREFGAWGSLADLGVGPWRVFHDECDIQDWTAIHQAWWSWTKRNEEGKHEVGRGASLSVSPFAFASLFANGLGLLKQLCFLSFCCISFAFPVIPNLVFCPVTCFSFFLSPTSFLIVLYVSCSLSSVLSFCLVQLYSSCIRIARLGPGVLYSSLPPHWMDTRMGSDSCLRTSACHNRNTKRWRFTSSAYFLVHSSVCTVCDFWFSVSLVSLWWLSDRMGVHCLVSFGVKFAQHGPHGKNQDVLLVHHRVHRSLWCRSPSGPSTVSLSSVFRDHFLHSLPCYLLLYLQGFLLLGLSPFV